MTPARARAYAWPSTSARWCPRSRRRDAGSAFASRLAHPRSAGGGLRACSGDMQQGSWVCAAHPVPGCSPLPQQPPICPSLQRQVGHGAHLFTYDHVFADAPEADPPSALYDRCVAPLVEGLFRGYNATVFACEWFFNYYAVPFRVCA